jgi:hypothetical protein
MDLIEQAIDVAFDEHTKYVRQLQGLREQLALATAGAARFGGEVKVYVFWRNESPKIVWSVPVSSFKEAEPLIEFIEDWRPPGFALECKRTSEYGPLGHRDYHFEGLQLTCVLRDDSTACKRVITGYQAPEPIYEFRCDEAAA